MTLETFFEKFDQFAVAPDAVAKMRALLIYFAVSGRLAPNDPQEKAIGLALSEASSNYEELPANWRCGLLGDAFTFEYGDNLPAPKRTETGEYPVYGSNGIVGTHDICLTKEPAIIVGRKGSAGALNIATGPSWTTDVAYFVRPPSDLDLRFTYYLFSTLHLDDLGKGIKPGLSRKEAYSLPIAVPPLAEQKRIVAKVDELMALCDRLEAQQQERETRHAALARASLARFADAPTPANLNFLFHPSYTISPADLRKSILTLAVQGKLVPQDPNDEPAEEVVKRIRSEKAHLVAAGELKRERAIPKTDNSVVLYDLPNGWCWSQLGDLSLTVTSGSRDWAAHYSNEGAIFVRMGNLSRNSYRLRMDKIQCVAPPSNAEGDRTRLEAGDILISITGEVGLLGLIPDGFGEAYINQHICLVRLPQELQNRFIPEFFRSPFAQEHFNAPQRGLKNSFRLTDVTTLPTPLPPLAEQRRIVAKVDQLMGLVDELDTQLAASRAIAEKLMEAVVAELTTQD